MSQSPGITLYWQIPTNLEICKRNLQIYVIVNLISLIFLATGLILEYLKFITVYFRQHFGDLFLFEVFKGKVNCHSIMDSLHIPSELIGTFPILLEAVVLRASPSARCAGAANTVYQFVFL
jgi:hypothetical protein